MDIPPNYENCFAGFRFVKGYSSIDVCHFLFVHCLSKLIFFIELRVEFRHKKPRYSPLENPKLCSSHPVFEGKRASQAIQPLCCKVAIEWYFSFSCVLLAIHGCNLELNALNFLTCY